MSQFHRDIIVRIQMIGPKSLQNYSFLIHGCAIVPIALPVQCTGTITY